MESNIVLEKNSLWERLLTIGFVVTPHPALILGGVLFWMYGVDWLALGLFFVFFILTSFSITVGFHRYFTHQSFELSRIVQYFIAVFGMMSAEMSLFKWVAFHRAHHQYSDKEGDPHSPHHHGGGCWGIARGFLHAHLGWFSKKLANEERYIGNLREDPWLVRINALFPLWVFLGFFLPTLIAYLWTGDAYRTFLGFLWGGWIRLGAVYHLTWSINSICHIWGRTPFVTRDESRNNTFFGIVGFGEGWHNNHHAFPTSARHGLRWYQVDGSWYVICFLRFFGLARKPKLPSAEDYERIRKRSNAV